MDSDVPEGCYLTGCNGCSCLKWNPSLKRRGQCKEEECGHTIECHTAKLGACCEYLAVLPYLHCCWHIQSTICLLAPTVRNRFAFVWVSCSVLLVLDTPSI